MDVLGHVRDVEGEDIGIRVDREVMKMTEVEVGVKVGRVGSMGGIIKRHPKRDGALREETLHRPGFPYGLPGR